MKQVLFRLAVLIITFSLGATVNWFLPKRNVDQSLTPHQVETSAPAIAQIVAQPPTTPVFGPSTNLIFDYDRKQFSPEGEYSFAGQHPKEFPDFQSFAVWFREEGYGDPQINVLLEGPDGLLNGERPVVFALVTEQRVFFVTSEGIDGYGYRFDGTFLRRDVGAIEDESVPVIRGTLTKTRHGRTVSHRVVSFAKLVHGC